MEISNEELLSRTINLEVKLGILTEILNRIMKDNSSAIIVPNTAKIRTIKNKFKKEAMKKYPTVNIMT